MPDLNQDEQRRYSWYARFMQQAGAAPKSFDEWRNLFNQQRIDVSPQGTDRDNGPVMSGELAKNATGEATYEIQRQATNPWDGFWESFFNAARGKQVAPDQYAATPTQPAGDDIDQYANTPEFQQWFGRSKAVHPETGKPLVLYHGTKQDRAEAIGREGWKPNAQGLYGWFSPDPNYSNAFTETLEDTGGILGRMPTPTGAILPVHVSAQNPKLVMNEYHFPQSREEVEELRRQGHDSVMTGQGKKMQLAVFSPEQIKSVFNKTPSSGPHLSYGLEDASATDKPQPRPKVQNDPLVTTLSEIMDQYVQKQRTIQEWTQDLDRALRRQSLAKGFDPTADRHHLVKQLGDALDHEMLVAQLTDMLDMRSSSYSADDEIDLGAEPDRYPEQDEYALNPPLTPKGAKEGKRLAAPLYEAPEGLGKLSSDASDYPSFLKPPKAISEQPIAPPRKLKIYDDTERAQVKDFNATQVGKRMKQQGAAGNAGRLGYAPSEEGHLSFRSTDPHYNIAASMQDIWAEQSSNTVASAALQDVIGEVFNNKSSVVDHSKHLSPLDQQAKARLLFEHADDLRHFVKAQYDHTQDVLKKKGIEHLVVYRGRKSSNPQPQYGVHEPIEMHPASSFSLSYDTAMKFAGPNGHVIAMKVPADRIFSTAMTGIGCLPEHEVVVLNHPENRAVVVPGDPSTKSAFWRDARNLRSGIHLLAKTPPMPEHLSKALEHLTSTAKTKPVNFGEDAINVLYPQKQEEWLQNPKDAATTLAKHVLSKGSSKMPESINLNARFIPLHAKQEFHGDASITMARHMASQLKDYVPIVEAIYMNDGQYRMNTRLVHKANLQKYLEFQSRIDPKNYLQNNFYIANDRLIPFGKVRLKSQRPLPAKQMVSQ